MKNLLRSLSVALGLILAFMVHDLAAVASKPATIGGTRGIYFQAIFQGTVQEVAYTGTAGQSSALQAGTQIVQLTCTTDCFVLIGANPTATTANGTFIQAKVIQTFAVTGGQKISVIQSAAGGNLCITEGA